MKVSHRNEEQEILVQTVTVTHNTNNPANIYLFRCFRCGSAISQVIGNITKIFPGLEPDSEVSVINKCTQCKELYSFQTHDMVKTPYARITLSQTGKINTFHCFICRNPQLQFNEHIIMLLPAFRQIMLPYKFDCLNPACPMKYNIVDMV